MQRTSCSVIANYRKTILRRLYDHYRNEIPWKRGLPADLIPPIKHLRKTFDRHHWEYGRVTEKLCYAQLHPDCPVDLTSDYIKPLNEMKVIAGPAATQRFVEHLKMGTHASVFKAFFDLYVDCITIPALAIFQQLVAVGRANESRLDSPHVQWAEAQTKNLIRSQIHLIPRWVQDVCDIQPCTPEDMDEQLLWQKWQAPMFIIMRPSRYMEYDPARIWERNDPETSQGWLETFAEHYVLSVEGRLEKLAGQTALELAKQPPPETVRAVAVPPVAETAAASESQPKKPIAAKLKSKIRGTKAKYKRWQVEYKRIAKSNPDKSDVWISRKIAGTAIGNGSSADTIRKHMK
jgi:hypothetical protein